MSIILLILRSKNATRRDQIITTNLHDTIQLLKYSLISKKYIAQVSLGPTVYNSVTFNGDRLLLQSTIMYSV